MNELLNIHYVYPLDPWNDDEDSLLIFEEPYNFSNSEGGNLCASLIFYETLFYLSKVYYNLFIASYSYYSNVYIIKSYSYFSFNTRSFSVSTSILTLFLFSFNFNKVLQLDYRSSSFTWITFVLKVSWSKLLLFIVALWSYFNISLNSFASVFFLFNVSSITLSKVSFYFLETSSENGGGYSFFCFTFSSFYKNIFNSNLLLQLQTMHIHLFCLLISHIDLFNQFFMLLP